VPKKVHCRHGSFDEKDHGGFFFKMTEGSCLSVVDRKTIGEDIKTVELGWPIGMPTSRPLGSGLYEVRSVLQGGVQARIFFSIFSGYMVLLHAFIKKTQKTPGNELRIARQRMSKFSQSQRRENET